MLVNVAWNCVFYFHMNVRGEACSREIGDNWEAMAMRNKAERKVDTFELGLKEYVLIFFWQIRHNKNKND